MESTLFYEKSNKNRENLWYNIAMKKIEWNVVTWYSKLAAIILFLLVLPTLTFYIGVQYAKTMEVVQSSQRYSRSSGM